MVIAPVEAAEEEHVCHGIQISVHVDDCIRQQYATADQQLNYAYKLLMADIDAQYKLAPKLGADFKSSIKMAQQAWLGFRDSNCALEVFEIERGTPEHNKTIKACKLRMTKLRTQEIKSILK